MVIQVISASGEVLDSTIREGWGTTGMATPYPMQSIEEGE